MTTTGATIELIGRRCPAAERRDTRRIDAAYRVHYLQWTGISVVDRVLGVRRSRFAPGPAFFGLRAGLRGEGGVSGFLERIVCLTEETTETLFLLGQGDRIVGVSGYTVRPPEARSKPKVSAFISANVEKIESLRPDLVLAFSDLQADIAAALVRRGMTVMVFNQRSVAEILQMIRTLGGLVGCAGEADRLASGLEADLERIRTSAGEVPDAAPRLLRGMGRPAHLGHPVGGRARRDRQAASPSSPSSNARLLARDRIVDRDGGRAPRPGGRVRVVVRQEGAEGDDRRAARDGTP